MSPRRLPKPREEQEARLKAEQLNQDTNFLEYLGYCHEYLHQATVIQLNKTLSTGGNTTDPRKRFVPTTIKPWTNFRSLQWGFFNRVLNIHTSNGFPRVCIFLSTLGGECGLKPQGSEDDLKIDTRVESVINHLSTLPEAHDFGLVGKISVENHASALGAEEKAQVREMEEKVREALGENGESTTTQTRFSRPFSPLPDQFLIFITGDKRSRILYVEEKPFHKFSTLFLRDGLKALHDTDILRDIVNNPRRSDKAQNTRLYVVAVLTQTFDYRHSHRVVDSAYYTIPLDASEPAPHYQTREVMQSLEGIIYNDVNPYIIVIAPVVVCMYSGVQEVSGHRQNLKITKFTNV
ncbi:MAG: hypothetical protein M1840_001884 [Geoglossum simile]|nr:MAG: hypothetical protein M1840_001884 [Geoglossum simile]